MGTSGEPERGTNSEQAGTERNGTRVGVVGESGEGANTGEGERVREGENIV